MSPIFPNLDLHFAFVFVYLEAPQFCLLSSDSPNRQIFAILHVTSYDKPFAPFLQSVQTQTIRVSKDLKLFETNNIQLAPQCRTVRAGHKGIRAAGKVVTSRASINIRVIVRNVIFVAISVIQPKIAKHEPVEVESKVEVEVEVFPGSN